MTEHCYACGKSNLPLYQCPCGNRGCGDHVLQVDTNYRSLPGHAPWPSWATTEVRAVPFYSAPVYSSPICFHCFAKEHPDEFAEWVAEELR